MIPAYRCGYLATRKREGERQRARDFSRVCLSMHSHRKFATSLLRSSHTIPPMVPIH